MNFLQEPQKNQDNQLQEIDLSDYVKVIKKEKKIIISFFLIGIVLGVIWFFVGPTEYIGSSLIEVGGIKDNFQQIDLIDNPEKTLQKIENELFDSQEINFLGDVFKGTNLIEIKIEGNNYEKVESALTKINEDILKSHFLIFEQEIDNLVKEKEFLDNKIAQIQEEISFLMIRGFDTAPLRAQIHSIEIEIEQIKAEISKILMTQIIEGPNVVEKKQSYLVIIFLAMFGLFVGFILAFLKNSWHKNKNIL